MRNFVAFEFYGEKHIPPESASEFSTLLTIRQLDCRMLQCNNGNRTKVRCVATSGRAAARSRIRVRSAA